MSARGPRTAPHSPSSLRGNEAVPATIAGQAGWIHSANRGYARIVFFLQLFFDSTVESFHLKYLELSRPGYQSL